MARRSQYHCRAAEGVSLQHYWLVLLRILLETRKGWQMRRAGILLSLVIGIVAVGCAGGTGLKHLSPWASLGDPVNGKEIYVNTCVRCHGIDGKGAPGAKLVPPPADLSSDAVQSRPIGTLFSRIHGGKANIAMGRWTHTLSDEEVWDVLDYVRTLRVGNEPQP